MTLQMSGREVEGALIREGTQASVGDSDPLLGVHRFD
jgi:hypothetical protein